MAFTEAQKSQIRLALGFPDVHLDNNSRLESAMDLVGERAATKAIVDSLLTQLTTISTSIQSSLSSAGLKRAEDIEWYEGQSGSAALDQKRSEGRNVCAQLSIIFGVPIMADMFGTIGNATDAWMSPAFQIGGPINLG
jgi:hypothetical protein